MDDSNRDRTEGKLDELGGKAKEAFGDLQGDENLRREGQAEQAEGETKQGIADIKDKVGDAVRKVTDR